MAIGIILDYGFGELDLDEVAAAAKAKVKAWLSSVFVADTLHKANIVLGGVLNGTNSVTNVHRFEGSSAITSAIVAGISIGANLLSTLTRASVGSETLAATIRESNGLLDELKNPNIEGIPIHANAESESCDLQVNQQLVINQASMSREYHTDNAAVQPKQWTIKGYLMSNPNYSPVETGLIVKPGLLVQRRLLQLFVDSRMPVWFKTHDNRFYKVLISHFDTSYIPDSLNALAITVNLVEYNAMSVTASTMPLNILSLKE